MSRKEILECCENKEGLQGEEVVDCDPKPKSVADAGDSALDCKELDLIQTDINNLMTKLNTYITDADVHCTVEDDETEKQDGASEKELCMSLEDLYVTDGENPPKINWDTAVPVIMKHLCDLQRLHDLNQMTLTVVKRIRNVASTSKALLEDTIKQTRLDVPEPEP